MLEIDPSSEIRLSGTNIYFDSKRAVPLSFVTSGNVVKLPRSEKIVATPETIKLLGNKTKGMTVLSSPYGKTFTLGLYSIELIPSGRMLGSAQVVVEKDGERLLYAGSFKLKASPTARHAELRGCDTLVVNCAYGTPKPVFPEPEAVMRSLLEFVNEVFFEGKTPVILVNSPGKAQDVAIFLAGRNVRLSLHPSVASTLRTYGELGVKIPRFGGLKRKYFGNEVLVAPFRYHDSEFIRKLERKKVAAVTDLFTKSGALVRTSFGAEAAFPLTDHPGHDEISDYLDISRPKNVILKGNYSERAAESLRAEGWNVKTVREATQLSLF